MTRVDHQGPRSQRRRLVSRERWGDTVNWPWRDLLESHAVSQWCFTSRSLGTLEKVLRRIDETEAGRASNRLSSPQTARIAGKGQLTMPDTDRIEINPRVMMGKPVIHGTRITVELVLRKLSEGATDEELLDAYPRLTREDIHAALRYAADTVAHEDTLAVIPPEAAADR